ncbi:MAG TPA: HDOD domain-containing protein [Phycisphaerales bacterium]|nr:HDOD domain-containing protein [Phycisphaerales bacterium]
MTPRNSLTASELADLHCELARRLAEVGLASQPPIAARILDLTKDPTTGLNEYAKVIRHDPALSGRLIRLANSAFFAQRKPVTNVDRACVLLGLDRLRSVALGFYLSRGAATEADQRLSREVWSQSLYRACLAAEIARSQAPTLVSEAFVIGLMLDAGIPLTHALLGGPFKSVYRRGLPPMKMHHAELAELPYTHVDVVGVLTRRWRFPDLLSKPIEWHHTPPGAGGRQDPVHALHRIAYYVGSIVLCADGAPAQRAPMAAAAEAHLGLDAGRLAAMVAQATGEYSAVVELFSEVADALEASRLASAVHQQLVDVLDEQMASEIADATRPRPQQFRLGGLTITLRPDSDGLGTAYTYDSSGEPLSTYRFIFASETVESLREALGLESDARDDADAISEYLTKLAA